MKDNNKALLALTAVAVLATLISIGNAGQAASINDAAAVAFSEPAEDGDVLFEIQSAFVDEDRRMTLQLTLGMRLYDADGNLVWESDPEYDIKTLYEPLLHNAISFGTDDGERHIFLGRDLRKQMMKTLQRSLLR